MGRNCASKYFEKKNGAYSEIKNSLFVKERRCWKVNLCLSANSLIDILGHFGSKDTHKNYNVVGFFSCKFPTFPFIEQRWKQRMNRYKVAMIKNNCYLHRVIKFHFRRGNFLRADISKAWRLGWWLSRRSLHYDCWTNVE